VAAAILKSKVNARKYAIIARFRRKLVQRLSSKITKAEVTDCFQDGRRRQVGHSCACYQTGNYHPILKKIGT
jgi:hypothetical protein